MKDFVKIFKILYRNQQQSNASATVGNKKVSRAFLYLISFLPLVALVCVIFVFMTKVMTSRNQLMLFTVTILSSIQAGMLFLMISNVLTLLYNSEDTAFLNSLPVKPYSIYFAKLALIYVNSLKFSVVTLLPVLLTTSITYNVISTDMFYGFYVLIPLIVLFVPVLPLFLVTILSLPIKFLSSYLKGRASLKSILSIIFYVIIMSAYFAVIFSMQNVFQMQNISAQTIQTLNVVANVFYPNKTLVAFCYGIDAGKNFGIFLAITVAMLIVSVLLSALFYKRTITNNVETRNAQTKHNVSYKQKSVVSTLMSKDFKTIIRNPSMAMSMLGNILITPIIIVAIYFFVLKQMPQSGQGAMTAFSMEMNGLAYVMLYSIMFFGGINTISLMSYTREGKSFFMAKTLPIKAKDSILSKLYIALIVPVFCEILIMLLSFFLLKINVVSVLLYFVVISLISVGSCSMNILFDMKFGNMYWTTAAEMRKNNGLGISALIPVAIALVPAFVFMILGMMLPQYVSVLGYYGVLGIFWGVAVSIAVILCAVGLCLLKYKGEEYYQKIGSKKYDNTQKKNRARIGNGMLK